MASALLTCDYVPPNYYPNCDRGGCTTDVSCLVDHLSVVKFARDESELVLALLCELLMNLKMINIIDTVVISLS